MIHAMRSPQNWFCSGIKTCAPFAIARSTVLSASSTYTKITTGELPSGVGARLGRVGHSASIMIIAGPIVIKACATFPSGPGRRLSSTASNVLAQKSIAAVGSRHTNLGMTTDELSGTPFTFSAMGFPFKGGRLNVFESQWPGLLPVSIGEAVFLGQCRCHKNAAWLVHDIRIRRHRRTCTTND